MSELMNPQPAKARPGVVTASSYLLYLVAALQVVSLLVMLTVFSDIQRVYEEAFAGTEMEGAAGFATAAMIGSAVLGLLVAIGLVVLAILNNRGKNASRIVTWVVGGLFLCCSGFGLVTTAVGSAVNTGPAGGNVPDQAEIQRRLEETLPSWYTPASMALSVISLLALLVALILLALPAANEFFKRPQQAWEPPLPGSSYPTAPGSAYPTYPPSAGPPSYPTYPPAQGAPPANPPGGPSTNPPATPPANPPTAPPAGPSGTPPAAPPAGPSGAPPADQSNPPGDGTEPPRPPAS